MNHPEKPSLVLFSGLGADERAFSGLDLSPCEVHFVKWMVPQRNETMEAYARRLAGQILAPNPILVGLSFGGMMAMEVAKFVQPTAVVLLASAKDRKEVPWYYRLAGNLGLHGLIPAGLLLRPNKLVYWMFGAKTAREKALLLAILRDTDPVFLKWAMHAVVKWKLSESPVNVVHIHGDQDHVLPIQYVKPDFIIKGAGHLMTLDKAKEISALLKEICRRKF